MTVDKFYVGDRVRSNASGQTGTVTRTPQFRNDYYRVTWDDDSVRFGCTVSKVSPMTMTHYYARV